MDSGEIPSLEELLGGSESSEEAGEQRPQGFTVPERFVEDPKPYFRDKDYYKKVLEGVGDEAKRLHESLNAMLKAREPRERSAYRERVVPAYWSLATSVAERIGEGLSIPKILLLRFGIVSPAFLSKEQRDTCSRVIFDNNTGEPIHYLDEWLLKVARGLERPSTTDEVKPAKQDSDQKVLEILEKRKGKRESEFTLLQNRVSQLDQIEAELRQTVDIITEHTTRPEYGGLKEPFSEAQRGALATVSTLMRRLSTADREVKQSYVTLENLDAELASLSQDAQGVSGTMSVDKEVIGEEFDTIRQMMKMCVGRRGNHFPVLMQQYAGGGIDKIATRENVIQEMAFVESFDPGLFSRTFKGQTNRIVPNVFLLSCYGDQGICWEPFEKYNKGTSKGRIAVPLFPKSVRTAVISALADLRWLVAKEKAQHYWMEEGLTGWYYQWFSNTKQKGDVKDAFVRDYYLWLTAESSGMQKLDKDVRGVFWRNIPFPQEVKEDLKNRGFVYSELYKRDENISKTDGY